MNTTTEHPAIRPPWGVEGGDDHEALKHLYESRASFGIRYRALTIDWMTAMGIGLVFSLITNRAFRAFLENRFASPLDAPSRAMLDDFMGYYGFLLGLAAGLVMALALIACMEALLGVTPGKQALQLSIRHASGMPADRLTLLLRALVKNMPALFAILAVWLRSGLFGFLSMISALIIGAGSFMALDQKRQTLYDRIAETAVYPRWISRTIATGESPRSSSTRTAPNGTAGGNGPGDAAQMSPPSLQISL